MITPWSSVLSLNLASEGGVGDPHYSILHGLFLLLGPLAEWVPRPEKQPDLLLNTLFVFVTILVLVTILIRTFKRIPEGSIQTLFEMAVEGLTGFFVNIVGERGRKYIPFFASFFIYIWFMNMLGIIPGFQSPTADLNTTLGFALISVVAAHLIGLREIGIKAYLWHFWGEPKWMGVLMCPLHIIGEFAKVVSLSIRLFGNVFGEEMILLVLAGLSPVLLIGALEVPYLPLQVPMLMFAVFSGTIQAMIFSVLSAVYVAQFLDHGHGDEEH